MFAGRHGGGARSSCDRACPPQLRRLHRTLDRWGDDRGRTEGLWRGIHMGVPSVTLQRRAALSSCGSQSHDSGEERTWTS
jgi:hypothetical protein